MFGVYEVIVPSLISNFQCCCQWKICTHQTFYREKHSRERNSILGRQYFREFNMSFIFAPISGSPTKSNAWNFNACVMYMFQVTAAKNRRLTVGAGFYDTYSVDSPHHLAAVYSCCIAAIDFHFSSRYCSLFNNVRVSAFRVVLISCSPDGHLCCWAVKIFLVLLNKHELTNSLLNISKLKRTFVFDLNF